MRFRSVFTAVALLAATGVFANVTDEQTFSYEIQSGGRISVDNVNGNVTIIGGPGNQVEITAIKNGKNQALLDQIQIIIEHSEDTISIETKFHGKGITNWFSSGKDDKGVVRYTIMVPTDINLESIESVNGNLEISGVSGTVEASTVNGSIKASDLSGNTTIETVNGSVDATFTALSGQQKAVIESVNGRLTITLPRDSNAKVSAESFNGRIDGSDFGLKINKGFIGRELEGDIGNGSARLALSTVNGAIKIRSY